MKDKEIFKGVIQVEKIRYFKDNWGIILASVVQVKKGEPQYDKTGFLVMKGNMAKPEYGESYMVDSTYVVDPKWGNQYEIISIGSVINIDTTDAKGQKQYLLSLYTNDQVQEMYETLESPFNVLDSGDYEKLVQVKGIGIKKAMWMIEKFRNNYSIAKMMIELEDYGLTNSMMKKLLEYYKSADLAIEKVKTNPYSLSEMNGIGFAKADAIALAGGMNRFSIERISSYITYFLNEQANNGFNYISTDLLMDGIVEVIGEDVPDFAIAESVHKMKDKLWFNNEKTMIGLMKYYNLERSIAKELIRIRDAKTNFVIDDWEEVVHRLEIEQGWKYTEQQKIGIETVLKNNIVCVTGLAGCGKTTIAQAMLKVLDGYSSAICALAGKASARIAEVTGQEGYTIHRLLGYPTKEKEGKNKFSFHDENPLPYDIIIVDEVSMIGGFLFYYLLRAIKPGAKLILLGDISQLESIGECKVAADIISSPEIPTVILDKIHRQAAKSAIITESIKIHNGEQIISKEWVGNEIRGELQDLLINCYSDKTNTFYNVLEQFQKEISGVNSILDIQILCPVKNNGDASTWNINNAIQELYNPKTENKKQVEVFSQGRMYYLREGDKIINKKNNYHTVNIDGVNTPVYNGNIGIIREIDEKNDIYIIDFESIGTIVMDKSQLNSVELGYAISVHSSQGSQWSNVIIALDYSSYSLLSRELVYTALTRAKKHCTLVAQNNALRYATLQQKISQKTSHLVELLDEIANPKIIF